MLVICSFPSHTHLSLAQIINLKYLSLVFWDPLESDHFLKVHSFPKGTLYISQTHLLPSVLILHTFAHVMSPVWTVVSPTISTLSLPFLSNTLAGPLLLRIWLVLAWVCHFCSVCLESALTMTWTMNCFCLSHTLLCAVERVGGLEGNTEYRCFVKEEKEKKETVMTLCLAPSAPLFLPSSIHVLSPVPD